MELKLDISGNTLFIIPCCKTKEQGGQTLCSLCSFVDPLSSSTSYKNVTSARAELLNTLRLRENSKKYMSGEYSKNKDIRDGPDFGLDELSGRYLPAIDRYQGKLYSAVLNFSKRVKDNLRTPNKPKMLILSALYGPLHPCSMIQDYNLKMSDSPAHQTWEEHFPPFLEEYVQMNKINSVQLYLGSKTCYFKVAKEAITPLLEKKLINQAIQFEVEQGNSNDTPHNHGLLVSAHLKLTKSVVMIELKGGANGTLSKMWKASGCS
jgi:cytoplasmic iron level regulating protein YaaA (DUF328/UPF0246 family)